MGEPTGESRWAFEFGKGRPEKGFRIRAVTAGASLTGLDDRAGLEAASAFLDTAQARLEAEGYEIQTLRIATPPLVQLLSDGADTHTAEAVAALERQANERGHLLGVGPIAAEGDAGPDTVVLAKDIAAGCTHVCFSLPVASAETGPDPRNLAAAGEIVAALAATSPGGEAAFRFAAAACCPPGIPFFPAAYHAGPPAFSLGIEAPDLINDTVVSAGNDPGAVAQAVAETLDTALAPLEALADSLAEEAGVRCLGIDLSPAPMREASIGRAIESLTGKPMGGTGTLAACAAITRGLRRTTVKRCGFSGLMLPLLEDAVLAARAAEGRYAIGDLLAWSSVCGTGLDTVPVPGESSPEALTAVIGDMAALAAAWDKPLVARLLPIPGKRAGEAVSFETPFLMDSRVLPLSR